MSQQIAPVAKQVSFVHKYHGKEFDDPYHWLKDMDPKEKRPEIIEYLKEENAYAESHFKEHEVLTKKLYDEMVSRIKEDDQAVGYQRGPFHYFNRTEKGKNYPIYLRRKDGVEEVILDQNEMAHDYQDLGSYQVSPDHSMLAYSMDFNGYEDYQIFFKDLKTGNILESETIQKASASIVWAEDGKTIFYLTLDEIHRADKLYRHTIGVKDDVLVYHEKDPKFELECFKSQSGKFVFVKASSKETSEVWYVDANSPAQDLKLFHPRETGHTYHVEHQGERFLVLTNGKKQYLNNRLCSCPLTDTRVENWSEVIPYNPYVNLDEIIPFQNHIGCFERSNALVKLRILQAQNGILDSSDSVYNVDIPSPLYALSSASYKSMDYESSLIRFEYDTPVSKTKVIEYDMSKKSLQLLKEYAITNFNPDEYTMEMIYAPIPEEHRVEAPFGTPVPDSIPISILYKTSLFKKDGTNPLYLYGYGSYGISIEPGWKSLHISLADRGFVTATAHIRGGGDNGIAWYEAGKYKYKKNTFHDFITAGKKLFEEKYSSPQFTAIDGRSAGGLLIGAVLNMEPQMCKVALAGVPFVDVINTMMDPSIPLTVNEYEEWGNPNDKDYFDYMLTYSPYDNIPKDQKFPDLLVKAGLFDPRVQYWEPTKWVAKVRSMNVTRDHETNPSVIVYDCKLGSGHFGSTGRYDWIKEIAKEYAFMIHRIQRFQSVVSYEGETLPQLNCELWKMNGEEYYSDTTNFAALYHPSSYQNQKFVPINAAALLIDEINSPMSGTSSFTEELQDIEHLNIKETNQEYRCADCGKTFPKLVALRSHEIVHKAEKNHQCEFCQKAFARRHDMLRHERTVHAAEKSISCATCNLLFQSLETLLQHCKELGHALPEKRLKKSKRPKKLNPATYIEPRYQPFGTQVPPYPQRDFVPPADHRADLDTWFRSVPHNPNVYAHFRPNLPAMYNYPVHNPPVYGTYPNPHHQTYAMPVPDPAYSAYVDPSIARHHPHPHHYPTHHPEMQPAPFVPNMYQTGYQMTTNAPQMMPKRPPPTLSVDTSLQQEQPYFETEQPFFQFEKRNLHSPSRIAMFEDPYESVCDGLIIQDNQQVSYYPPLPGQLLTDHMDL